MENLDNEIQNNINSLIYQRFSNGIMELDTDKLIDLIRRNYRLEVDYETLNSILSKNPHVDSISDKKIILKQETGENVDDTSEIDKAVHQNALDAIDDHMEAEAFDLMNSIHKGDTYNSRDIMLEETDNSYLLHQSARKNNQVYMVSDIKPSTKLSESLVTCRIGTSRITIDLPLKCFKKKIYEGNLFDLDAKEFIRVWTPPSYPANNSKQVYDFCNLDSFTEDNGYSEEDISEIKKLDVGDKWKSAIDGDDHIVVRIK